MSVLVDTSIWVDYFKGIRSADILDFLIEENLVATNQIILAELLPLLFIQNQKRLIGLIREIKQHPMNVDWDGIVQMRITCLKNGLNGIGIPDLLIAQNAIQGDLMLLSADNHFSLLAKHLPLALYQAEGF